MEIKREPVPRSTRPAGQGRGPVEIDSSGLRVNKHDSKELLRGAELADAEVLGLGDLLALDYLHSSAPRRQT